MGIEIIEGYKEKVTSYEQSLQLAKAGFDSFGADSWWRVADKTLVQDLRVTFAVSNNKKYAITKEDGELEEVIPAYRLDKLLEFSPENDIDEMLAKAVEMIVSQCDGDNGATSAGGLDDRK